MKIADDTKTIMIVEDSDDDFDIIMEVLMEDRILKNPVVRCEDGKQTMDYLHHKGHYSDAHAFPRPGLIILDLNIPGLDGRRVLDNIKSDAQLSSVPIVVLTTSVDGKDVDACYDLGANSYVKKPVNYHEFVAAIKQIKDYWFEVSNLPNE
jgi:two-component system, response regulator